MTKHDLSIEEEAGWSFLKSPRWLGYYALIIVFSIACVFLGNWQFDRRDEARAEINRIELNYNSSPVPIAEALPTLASFDLDTNKWQSVTIKGKYIGEPFLARNRAGAQGVGSILVHPLQLADGTVFFVDRGWVPVNAMAGVPEVLPLPSPGNVEIIVRLRQSEEEIKGRETAGRTIGSINLPELERLVKEPSFTGAYGQLVQEIPEGETGVLPPKPERDEGPHLSYALQWYVFILIVLAGAWYAATLEWRSLNSSSAEKQKQKKQNRRKLKNKITDAEEEDAYLDAKA